MIEFQGVVRRFGRTVAVDELTLSIGQGELFALLGPNGAGKTTTIRMLAGLLRPDAGGIRICGQDAVAQVRQANRFLGYVPEEPFLYEKLSGREILEFAAEMHGLDHPTILDRIEREAQRFQMTGYLDNLAETYSHGMKQRVVFAAALLHDPPVLVVDEPTVGLDPRSVRVVKDMLRSQAAAGKTVFMSTHVLAFAEEIAGRIGILHRGRLSFLGTLDELQKELAAPRTALEPLFLKMTDGGPAAPARAAPS
ncbi:MAG: ABC transporter ATP-binding protein [Thermoguttaceae bacterium]|jgi:ABC-2 type transport system ATP-binding protein